MLFGRAYTAAVNISASFTAQIDMFELLAASGKPLVLTGFELGQTSEVGDAQEEVLTLILKRITGSPTSGSGGGTSTFQPCRPNDTAAGATLETGNTTKLTGGTSAELVRFGWMIRQSVLYQPIPEVMHVIDAGTRAVLELATTPADSISTVQGWVSIVELV